MRVPSFAAAALACGLSVVLAAEVVAQPSSAPWRSTELIGVPILGPDDETVGKVTDMLVGPGGQVEQIVIGVGGFLGLGEKNVALPFDEVHFTRDPLKAPPNPAPDRGMSAPAPLSTATPARGPASGNPASLAAGGPGQTAGAATAPDHGTINRTKDQLVNAPAFRFPG